MSFDTLFKFQNSTIYKNEKKKKATQNYKEHLINPKNEDWLFGTARNDVELLRNCRSHQMFSQLWKAIKSGWIEKGEKNITTVFGKSYADNACYSGFRYNTFGVPGATPNDNPTERTNQDIKGSRNQKGMIQVRRKFNNTILKR